MTSSACSRTWEVEAARDGRLGAAAQAELMQHLEHCTHCARQRRALADLQRSLRETTPHDDDVQLRRVRQRVLFAANQRILSDSPARGRRGLRHLGIAALALVCLSLAARFTPALLRSAQRISWTKRHAAEPIALRLTADHGARFEHVRRGDLEHVKLYAGNLHLAFDRSLHARLTVQTPDGEIEDLGTVFHVAVQNGQTVRITVDEGAVRFRRVGEPDVFLHAGQQFERPIPWAVPPVVEPEPAEPPPSAAPPARSHRQSSRKPQPTADTSYAEDQAYLEVLDLLRAGQDEEARAAARRYVRNYPHGLRIKELERLARSARP